MATREQSTDVHVKALAHIHEHTQIPESVCAILVLLF